MQLKKEHRRSSGLLNSLTPSKRNMQAFAAKITNRFDKELLEAAKNGNVQRCEKMLTKGAHLDYQDETGMTALHNAAWKNQEQVVVYLLKQQAAVDLENENGYTPLHWAAWFNSLAAAKLLIDANANVWARCKVRGMMLRTGVLFFVCLFVCLFMSDHNRVFLLCLFLISCQAQLPRRILTGPCKKQNNKKHPGKQDTVGNCAGEC